MKNILLFTARIKFRKNFIIEQNETLVYFLKNDRFKHGEWVYDKPSLIKGEEHKTAPHELYVINDIEALCKQDFKLDKEWPYWDVDHQCVVGWEVTKAVPVNVENEIELANARRAFKELLVTVTEMLVENIKEKETELEKELEVLRKKRTDIFSNSKNIDSVIREIGVNNIDI